MSLLLPIDQAASLAPGCNAAPFRMLLRECTSEAVARAPRVLSEDEVHLWYTSPSTMQFDAAAFQIMLSADEAERMARFHFERDQNNFLFARGMLRILLGSYLGAPPAGLCFAYSSHGKPSLASSPEQLQFNLSHSGGKVLIGFTQGRRIGVDIEEIRRDLELLDVAERFFSSAENEALGLVPESGRHQAFFSCWTRKEAFVKAKGEGLSCPLNSFDVSIAPEDEEVSLSIRGNLSESSRWKLHSLNLFEGHAAAVAIGTAHE